MPVIDDDGNLFGVVNVIDALAVALVLAVLVAGVAVIGVLGGDAESETRYATVELGEQPDYLVDRISAGDEMTVEGSDHNLTITDVYVSAVTSAESGETKPHVTVRAEVNGALVETEDRDDPVFEFAGNSMRVGQDLEIETLEYVVAGRVTALDRDGESLSTGTERVLLETTVADTTADAISEGDEFRMGSHTLASVTTVRTYPIGGDERRVLLGVELATLDRGATPTFGGRAVTVGSGLTLSTSAYDLTGTVVRRGADEPSGESTSRTVEIELENVDPAVANGLEAGMTETERGETLATIRSVETRPAEVVLESEDGNVYLREHPKNEDVTMRVELRTRQTDTGIRFHGESLREGDAVTLDFETVLVRGQVTSLNPSTE